MYTLFAKNAYEIKLKILENSTVSGLMIILKICYVYWGPLEAQSTSEQRKQLRNLHFDVYITHFFFSLSFFFRTVSWPIYLISAGKLFFSSVLKAALISLKMKWG